MEHGTGYDERLFRLLLAEYVRRSFPPEEIAEYSEVRVAICTPSYSYDQDGDSYSSQSIVLIHKLPLPRPAGPGPDRTNGIPGEPKAPPRPQPEAPAPQAQETEPDQDKAAAERDALVDATGDSGCWVWECATEVGDISVGYLITPAGDINHPVAFLQATGSQGSLDFGRREALTSAWQIADDQMEAGRMNCIDLRDRGLSGSISDMPLFIYSLRCQRIDRRGDVIGGGRKTPFPFCRHALARMLALRS